MDAQRWRLARELFEAVVDFPPQQWETLLRQQCPQDEALRLEVLELLQADAAATRGTAMVERAPDIVAELAQQLTAGNTGALAGGAASVVSGQRLGPFRLLQEIGRGGLGAVWLA